MCTDVCVYKLLPVLLWLCDIELLFCGYWICEMCIDVWLRKLLTVLLWLCDIDCYCGDIGYVKCVLMCLYVNCYRYYCDCVILTVIVCILDKWNVYWCVYVNCYRYYCDCVILNSYCVDIGYVKCVLMCVYVNCYRYYCDRVILHCYCGDIWCVKCVLMCVNVNC
jgi:hypothetical protein